MILVAIKRSRHLNHGVAGRLFGDQREPVEESSSAAAGIGSIPWNRGRCPLKCLVTLFFWSNGTSSKGLENCWIKRVLRTVLGEVGEDGLSNDGSTILSWEA